MNNEYKYISLENDFYNSIFEEICTELEAGNTVMVGSSCIGHTRAAMTERAYLRKLAEKYPNLAEVRPAGAWKDCLVLK